MSSYKQFDRELYNQNNDRAIYAILSYLNSEGLYAVRNDDLYGPDIVVYKGFRPDRYVEVECKVVWKSGEFPWKEIQLPQRKEKFLKLGKTIEFWILRNDLAAAVIIPDYVITDDLLVEVPNKYEASGEFFFRIATTNCSYQVLSQDSTDSELSPDNERKKELDIHGTNTDQGTT